MAKVYSELSEELRAFMAEQKMFFVATAPDEGRVNVSPKGMDTLRRLDEKTVAYLDVPGSGNETAAHVLENGRMTMMMCSFSEQPLILRLYGKGRVVEKESAEWTELYPLFPPIQRVRQIFVLEIEAVQTSCGYGVPVYAFQEDREILNRIPVEK